LPKVTGACSQPKGLRWGAPRLQSLARQVLVADAICGMYTGGESLCEWYSHDWYSREEVNWSWNTSKWLAMIQWLCYSATNANLSQVEGCATVAKKKIFYASRNPWLEVREYS
jgi:hypothetical protein